MEHNCCEKTTFVFEWNAFEIEWHTFVFEWNTIVGHLGERRHVGKTCRKDM